MTYVAAADRYQKIAYRRSGRSGIDLPAISLGLWQNFGGVDNYEMARAMLRRAFDRGVTPFRSRQQLRAAARLGRGELSAASCRDFRPYRDELIISTKAGYDMWPGPYGDLGSRKYLLREPRPEPQAHGARLCRHLLQPPSRPGHAARRDDGGAGPRSCAVGQGALCRHFAVQAEQTRRAAALLKDWARRCLIHQPIYSMLNRWIEDGLLDALGRGRRRLHLLLAAGAGAADRQVSERASRTIRAPPRTTSCPGRGSRRNWSRS